MFLSRAEKRYQSESDTRSFAWLPIVAGLLLFYLCVVGGYTYYHYQETRKHLHADVDERLHIAATSVQSLLPDDYHDRARDAQSISDEEYREIVAALSQFTKQAGLLYAYTLVVHDGNAYYTSTNISAQERAKKEWLPYFRPWKHPAHEFLHALETKQATYSECLDDCGCFRTIFMPARSPGGNWYVIGVDYDIAYFEKNLSAAWRHSLASAAGSMFAGLPIFLFFIWASRRQTARIRAQEARLNAVIQDLPALVCRHLPDGEILFVNEAYCEYFGKSRHELIGKTIYEVIPPEEHSKIRNVLQQLDYDHPVIVNEYKAVLPSGETRYSRWTVRATFDKQAKAAQIQAYGEDITEQKRFEQERQQLETQLRHTQKMDAVGKLAGGIAHDFNNILTVVLGNTDLSLTMLKDQAANEKFLQQSLEQIELSAQRAASLTQQLLTFSRRDVVQPQALNLNTVLHEIEPMLRRLVGAEITLDIRSDQQPARIHADRSQLEQVIINLVANATQAMPNGGELLVETRNVELDEVFTNHNLDALTGRMVTLEVRDTGTGIDAETRERIFEPYFTTKAFEKGAGLGLATVHGIVTRFGGHITVDSELDVGTTFTIYFPTADATTEETTTELTHGEAPTGDETVLLCEDDDAVRNLISLTLRSAGYTVISAAHGNEGLKAARTSTQPIDLLITDVIMPDMNGPELAAALRQDNPALPTLFISGYTANLIAEHGVLDKDIEFLEKPFTRERLLQKIRVTLEANVQTQA